MELLGNHFRDDIGARITSYLDCGEVEWETLPPPRSDGGAAPRSVLIHFFSDRSSAKSWFGEMDGQQVLRAIGQHLSVALPEEAIWTANEKGDWGKPTPKELLALHERTFVKPKQAGTNAFRKLHHAAMIYAAKPCENLRSLLRVTGIDCQFWTRSVEFEAILQFVTRTSIRDPKSSEPVSL